ncbi:MAG: ABC transporter ATP-binding protein [Saccharofermentanales bacterium]|jgi:ABC-2 type transport system ATP-binding protein
MEKEVRLSVKNLYKSFGKHQVIEDLSFDLHAGEILGFLGPNGAGKSTTIKLIMGFLTLDYGEITICGKNHQTEYEEAMQNIGGIVENPEMYFYLSGRLNLEMYRRLHPGVEKSRIDEVIELLHMQKRADQKVKRYSLGMKQRMCIAQALLHKPKVLILDEPTNGLDPSGIRELRDLLIKLAHEEDVAVLVSSHQLAELQKMCDRVIIIDRGKLIDNQPINQMIKQTERNLTLFGFLDTNQMNKALELLNENLSFKPSVLDQNKLILALEEKQIPEVIFRLSQAHIALTSVQPYQTNLEELYLSITGGGNPIE